MLGSAMGLGLLAGIRLYATVFTLGLAIRMGWFHLSSSFSSLDVLAETPILALSGAACAIEFLADKVPWLDSLWDSIHTFIRPIGAAALGATALGSFDPTTKMLIALLCGGIAFTGHTSKAATRLVANHSPEPLSNFGLSLAEDLAVPAGLWIAFEHPVAALSIVGVFLILFAWLSPKIFRLLHVSWTALRGLVSKAFGSGRSARFGVSAGYRRGHSAARIGGTTVPACSQGVCRKGGHAGYVGIYCAATRTVPGLKNSTGYLFVNRDEVVFVARRLFRLKAIPVCASLTSRAQPHARHVPGSSGLHDSGGDIGFDVFKGRRARTQRASHLPGSRVNRFDILVFCSTYSNSRSSRLFPITFKRGTELDVPVTLEQPKQASFGELAAPVAFQLAKQLKRAPKQIAAELAEDLAGCPAWSRSKLQEMAI